MSIYRGLQIRMWGDAKFRALSHPQPNAQTLWVHLLSGPRTTILPGVILAGLGTLADDLRWMGGWSSEAIGECLREIEDAGMARTDLDAGVIWLPRGIDANPPKSQDNVKGWRNQWETVPECGLRDEIRAAYLEHMQQRGAQFVRAWAWVSGGRPKGGPMDRTTGPTLSRNPKGGPMGGSDPNGPGVVDTQDGQHEGNAQCLPQGGPMGGPYPEQVAPTQEQLQDRSRSGTGDASPRKREPPAATGSVIEQVREKTGRPWRSPHRHLTARLKAGATPEECILVAECKHDEWGGDGKMDRYVRQKTLYAPGNFDDYLSQALRWDEGGRKPQKRPGGVAAKVGQQEADRLAEKYGGL